MKVIKLKENAKKIAEIVVKSIKEGKVVVFPTDTVYGLLADATNERVVKRIFEIKMRDEEKPVPIFVKDMRMAKKLAFIDQEKEKILQYSWPGKVTFVLDNKEILPRIFKEKIGLRIPHYEMLNEILEKLDIPLTGTSANISGKPGSGLIKEVLSQFKSKKFQPDLVVDAGNLPKSKSSTVLDLTTSPPTILRA
ncbi:L-threonylcarbamoyladenylate synthase [Patescibacteria group bacterium]